MKIRTMAVVFAGVLAVAASASAAPAIRDYSSAGGRTANKASPKDTMYLVRPGDKITFVVKADGAEKYVWQVNKKADRQAAGGSFTWRVPDAKGIWEIHVIVSGGDGQAHQEWVVSTLSDDDAPTFFDYFTDRRYAGRKQTDPWARPLPEWITHAIAAEWSEWQEMSRYLPGGKWGRRQTSKYKALVKKLSVLDTSGGFVRAPSLPAEPNYPLHLLTQLIGPKNGMEFGTWKFRFRFPNGKTSMKGGKTNLKVYFDDNQGYLWYPFWYGVACDGFQGFRVGASKFDNDEKFPVDKNWHEVTLIRTTENQLYCYIDGVFKFRGKTARKLWKKAVRMNIGLARYQPDRYPKDTVYFDNIEIYEGRYLFPTKRVAAAQTGSGKKSIVVGGRDVGLKEIAEAIKYPKLFRYDTATKTAFCADDLIVSGGSDLIMSGETLKFQAGKSLIIQRNATLQADKSTISGGNVVFDHPFNVCLTETSLPETTPLQLPALAMGKWRLDRVNFAGSETDFVLLGDTARLNVYNSYFGAGDGEVRAVGAGKIPGTLGLVNCKFGGLKSSRGAGIAPKYYLDVRVVDRSGKALPNARVSIRNEVDDFRFPAENCEEFQPHGGGSSAYINESVIPRLISYTTSRTTLAGADGHTPGPKDAKKAIVLTDFVQNGWKKKEFTYTITVEAGSGSRLVRQIITGVNPGPGWFRADADEPAYTITAKLNRSSETVTEAQLLKKGLAGPAKKKVAEEK